MGLIMIATRRDIESRDDIETLMKGFYDRMIRDNVIGFIFTHYAKLDLESHLPIVADFWETVLFQKSVYKRGPKAMEVHLDLNKTVALRKQHFIRWLYIFHNTVDEFFEGVKAEKAKERSSSIAKLMQDRIGALPDCAEM